MKNEINRIFGPVPSRRLGYSLGVDIMPFKTCTYDCIYCQLGTTTLKTVERKEYVPVARIIDGLRKKLSSISRPEFVTISGSGEPTLNSGIGGLIKEIRKVTDIPVAVLTNGSLLFLKEVRESLMAADLVLPSFDAGDEAAFIKVNRPHREIGFKQMAGGLKKFCREFKGRTWLEVFLVNGFNADDEDIKKIILQTEKIKPGRIQLNTCDRPSASMNVHPVCNKRLDHILGMFGDNAEIISHSFHESAKRFDDSRQFQTEILNLIKRRPCRLNDLCLSTGLDPNEIVKITDAIIRQGKISTEISENGLFYKYTGANRT
jgi:wyosine [tRNA(Phe)-imidazoG37] synthetase (radical SAM superfamily)